MRRIPTASALVAALATVAALLATEPGRADAQPNGYSWSGDYATEEFGDPWDFANPEDWDMQAALESPSVGAVGSVSGGTLKFNQTRDAGGVLIGSARYGDEALHWGSSTWERPINTDVYRTLTFSMFTPAKPTVGGVKLLTCGGTIAACAVDLDFFPDAGWGTYSVPLPAGLNVYSILIIPSAQRADNNEIDWIRVTREGGRTEPLTSGSEPVPVVLDPNRAGGTDYAASVRGKAWTFDDPGDVASVHQLDGVEYTGGEFRGCSTGNDPAIVFAMGAPLDAATYNRFSARVYYEGGFSLSDNAGGGMNARVMWHTAGTFGYQVSQDIVVYPGWNDIVIPMLTNPAGLVTEPDIGRTVGWVGQIDSVRFDFHEDRGVRCVRMDSAAISAPDTASPLFDIRFQDNARGPAITAAGTTAEIWLDNGTGTFGGTRIASGLAVTNGVNTYTWPGGSVGKGTYWVWVRLTNPDGRQSSAYAGGPLVYTGKPPLAARSVTTIASDAPAGAAAVLANLTMTEAPGGGYITADRCEKFTGSSPTNSNGNFNPNQNVANLGVIPVDGSGEFCVFNESAVHLVADVQGFFSPSGNLRFDRSDPRRVLNTRTGARPDAGSITTVDTGIRGADAVLVNLTMTDGPLGGYISADLCRAFPGAQARSNGNFTANANIANLAVVPVDPDGRFCLYNESPVHLLVDVQGSFAPGAALGFSRVEPTRLIDTRAANQPGANEVIRIDAGVDADAVLVNITMTEAPGGGYITADRCNDSLLPPRPQTRSNGNFTAMRNIANLSVVPLGDDGTFCIYTERPVDILVDLQGTFSTGGPLLFSPAGPTRVFDSRHL